MCRQLEAVEAWHQARRATEAAAERRTASREARMDLARRRDVLREQHRAIVARTEEQLARGVRLLPRQVPLRAVLVHRNAWFVGKLTAELAQRGIEVVGAPENGAEGTGVVVVEQPDLLLVEDTLPMVSGVEVARETRRFAPDAVAVAQVAYEERVPHLLEAGAQAAYTRRMPPGDVAQDLLGLLAVDRRVDV